MYVIFHILCIIYCLVRLYHRYNKSSFDGVTGPTPGMETVIMVIFAPIFAIADVVVIAVMSSIRYYKSKQDESDDNRRIL